MKKREIIAGIILVIAIALVILLFRSCQGTNDTFVGTWSEINNSQYVSNMIIEKGSNDYTLKFIEKGKVQDIVWFGQYNKEKNQLEFRKNNSKDSNSLYLVVQQGTNKDEITQIGIGKISFGFASEEERSRYTYKRVK